MKTKSFSDKNLRIDYENSKDIFILFAALNALGYNDENNKSGMFWIRKKVRKEILKKGWDKKYPKLKKLLRNYHQWHLLNKLLSGNKKSIPNFNDFSNELLVKKLWKDCNNYQLKETKKLYPLFKQETQKLIKFIGSARISVKKIVLLFNPLDAYWRGYSFKIKNTGYVVVGPGAERNTGGLIRHELLHILAPKLTIPSRLITVQDIKRLSTNGYNNKNVISREYIIRGLNLLYEQEILNKNISKAIKNERKKFPQIKKIIKFLKNGLPQRGSPRVSLLLSTITYSRTCRNPGR